MTVTTEMERTMLGQPAALERIRVDTAQIERSAERIRSRRVWAVGTGTSWHAANIGAFWLRLVGEPLSVFPLTVVVQRIALECAVALGTDPDSFGLDRPGHREAWGAITL